MSENEKNRCAKVELLDLNDLKDFLCVLIPIYDRFSKKVFRDLQTGRLKKSGKMSEYLIYKGEKIGADHLYKRDALFLMNKHGFTKSFVSRNIIRQVLERYDSYIKRNKKLPHHKISFKNQSDKSFQIYQGCGLFRPTQEDIGRWQEDKNEERGHIMLNAYGLRDEKNPKFTYKSISNAMRKKEGLIKEKSGGYIDFKGQRAFFVARIRAPIEGAYEPVDWVGFDMNKTKDSFLVFNRPILFDGEMRTKISKNLVLFKRIQSQENKLKETNDLLAKDKQNKTKMNRSRYRKKTKKHHNKLKKLYSKLAFDIVTYCYDNKLGLAIDDLKTGNKNGSFGQDKICPLLKEMAEEMGIPHVVVPTPDTTRICHVCDYMHGKIPLNIRKFQCEKCKALLVRDENSAHNIAQRGKRIWEVGIKNADQEYKEKYGKGFLRKQSLHR
jgi:transposase